MKEMTNEELLSKIYSLYKYLDMETDATPKLTKLSYAEDLAEKREITKEEISRYVEDASLNE